MITGELTTNRLNGVSPAAPARQPEWLTTLRNAIASKITPEVIEQMLDAQIAKALKGDQKALKFVLELADKQPAAQPVHATQNIYHVHLPAGATEVRDELAVKLYSAIDAMGPASAGQIAANLGLGIDVVAAKLDEHPWFTSSRSRSGPPMWSIKRA